MAVFDPLQEERKAAGRDRTIIWLCVLTLCAVVGWSSVAELARVVRAEGQVVTATRTQIVQNLEGGILIAIEVEEGDRVAAGQQLMRLDPTRFEAGVAELEQQITALEIRRIRLEAEANEDGILQVPAELSARRPDLSRSEELVFETRTELQASTVSQLEQSISLREQEVSLLRPLVATRAVPELQMLNAELALVELETELAGFIAEQRRAVAAELSEVIAEIDVLTSTLAGRQDQLARTIVEAPSAGTVNQLFFSTLGAVVGPGEPILEIVPDEDQLLIEVRVEPQDIGFVTHAMRATLKVTAYDFTVHGTLGGEVFRIGADTVPHPTDQRLPAAFIVTIRIDDADKDRWIGSGRELRNGMVVEAELQASTTRVLDFVLRPVLRAREALAEL
ncbi:MULTISPECIES: HlyD family efflux transporter periplasmic adaptor subunit [unclassified Roseobacter]|uniref:HlyD family efflux transporter periplasmic adaptor subunit n=1 Tax=unclassified Roseobacter TaxID=196798 RepID=UPI0014929379|nr:MULTISPECIES: HlyD family efflux transporter periplasmic adaptor subunit [unclassified Roseobacter]NNY17880.1 HlyD family efflux transporter periplasmic adaptor subunit [Roseobacter sp. HKCCD8191]NNY52005.1 HlyD family efflux transporter periplasmic adaptor subunit [Roseobacter sp. HKCCD8190]NNZ28041.1 HlyD family efflux transporter periplasmic adaptor subunit [Roseobacter sp. HKCCD5856]NNZ37121.1 HlyD family efflux transporter periplasmic adaptor subunit [Roseobacter sp. HKCCD8749]NOA13203